MYEIKYKKYFSWIIRVSQQPKKLFLKARRLCRNAKSFSLGRYTISVKHSYRFQFHPKCENQSITQIKAMVFLRLAFCSFISKSLRYFLASRIFTSVTLGKIILHILQIKRLLNKWETRYLKLFSPSFVKKRNIKLCQQTTEVESSVAGIR